MFDTRMPMDDVMVGETPQRTLIRHIQEAIRDGRLVPGQKMQLREAFIDQYGYSSLTVQRAFTWLANEGYIVARGRAGTFVTENPPILSRMGMVFLPSRNEMLSNRHLQSLAANMTGVARDRSLSSMVYTGIGVEEDPRWDVDRRRFFDDLAQHRLAGVLFDGGSIDDEIRRRLNVPAVVLNTARRADDSMGIVYLRGLLARMVKEIAHLGGRRVAALFFVSAQFMADEFRELIRAAGLETKTAWIHGLDRKWVSHAVQGLFSLPPEHQPDCLLVTDDNFTEAAVEGLMRCGMFDRIPVIFHANFPVLSPLPWPLRQVGYDTREELRLAFDLIESMREARRRGHPTTPAPQRELSPKAEYEVKE